MKKFLVLLMLALAMVFTVPQTTTASQLNHDQGIVLVAADAGQIQTIVAVENSAGTQIIEPPNAGYSDVLNVPGKEAAKTDWFYWVIALIALLMYEVVFRLIPTTKSYSVITLVYNVINLLLKDRATGGGVFKIKKV